MNKKSIGILYFCIVLYLTFSCLYACTSDDEFNNASDFELETNASSSMIITEPSPKYTKCTDPKLFSHAFDLGDLVTTSNITYKVLADENLTTFRSETISWTFFPLPLPFPVEKRCSTKSNQQPDGTIRIITTFDLYRYYGSSYINDSHKDTLYLQTTEFHQ